MSDRFRPTRAGVINIWDYVDEEWVFADGRLALRGHNGSGKTKALEVLFPFVLDGVADSRRLDPFSGENRTMKSNLLYRGQESEYGYVWMEFARSARGAADSADARDSQGAVRPETVTLIVGMRAHRSTDGVRPSFYVTGRRLGVDFGLLSADSRPLTERQLRALLEPGAWRRTATEYRDLVDARLFGLGRERYAQLLDLLLALRRPLLAKDLDPAKVSDTLSSGLSPVDEDLILQAARDFENLAAVQRLFDDLTAASSAVRDFLVHYEAYLRAHVRFQLDRVRARADAAAGHAERIAAAAAAYRHALAAEQEALAQRNQRRDEGEHLRGRLAGLKNSEEYKAQGRIEDKRREVMTGAREVGDHRARLDRDRRQLREAEQVAGKLSDRASTAREAATRLAARLSDAALRSGIAGDGFGPVDAGDDILATARARVAARRDDVSQIRRLLEAIRDARMRRAYAEQELGQKNAAEQEQEQACAVADERLAQARLTAATELAAWAGHWSGPSGGEQPDRLVVTAAEAQALARVLADAGEPGAAGLAEVFEVGVAPRREAAAAARANFQAQLGEGGERLAGLQAERALIAAEQDDAPPASDLRPARRDGRPGAPLWQVVRFADTVGDSQAAAIEGALYGAGLLTAWVHPEPALTGAALAAAEADGYLVAGAPAAGRTLADVLVPEDSALVDPKIVADLLRCVALADELAGPGGAGLGGAGPGGAGPDDRPGLAAATVPVVSTKSQFSYGVHVGAHPKAAPEYIGATHRASRRQARLAACDESIAQTVAAQQRLAAERDRAAGLLADLQRARQELPDARPVARAADAAGRHAVLLARARQDTATARKAADAAIAEVDARTRQLRQAAAERRMPTAAEEVDAIARAAAEFENVATSLHGERLRLAQAEEDLAAQVTVVDLRSQECAQAQDLVAERERLQQALEEEFRALEETLQASVRQVLEQVSQTEGQISAATRAYQQLDARATAEHDKATGAQERLAAAREAFRDAVLQLYEQAAEFGDYAGPDLRPTLGVDTSAAWPEPARWPDPVPVSDELAGQLAAENQPADGVWSVLPAGVTDVLGAFASATRGGRQVNEGTLKNTADQMSGALKEFTDALAACDEEYRVDWEPGRVVVVHVIDDEGRKPAAAFAARIAERAADQGVLLEERERKVLEDELLAALAQQVHGRVLAARDLTRDMNADTRSKPMSSGIAVGIRWAQSDAITDLQRAASRLLERDAPGPERLAELRGLLREMIREYRSSHPRATYREALASALDYRSWHAFELLLTQPGEPEARLTRAKHSAMSGGEKSAAIHLPLFAAANALYSSAKDHCPRLVALDEAFVGIDERYKPDLFGLAVKFDLDLFMTGHDLWVTTATVPMIAHYDMYHDKATRTVSALLLLWDGAQLLDASAGYPDDEALATELLGFRPTRHAPLGGGGTLYYADAAAADAAAADAGDDDSEEEDDP